MRLGFFVFVVFVILSCEEEPKLVERKNSTELVTNSKNNRSGRQRPKVQKIFAECSDLPVGGGQGYDRIITSSSMTFSCNGCTTAVQRGEKLRFIIENELSNGETLFIPTSFSPIEVDAPIVIQSEITIAGDRGAGAAVPSEGVLIKSVNPTNSNTNIVFRVEANNTRITGMRIQGQSSNNQQTSIYTTGIAVKDLSGSVTNFECDNNEIFHCAKGVSINDVEGSESISFRIGTNYLVHHNDFHDNQYYYYNTPDDNGYLGYGIGVGAAFVKIYENILGTNRHDIAGSGAQNSGYEAYCNTILERNSLIANFDMHGRNSSSQSDAGAFIHIHHNDFQDKNCQGNIFIVGRPTVLCLIDNNKFATGTIYRNRHICDLDNNASTAIVNNPEQLLDNSAFGNVIAVNNIYDNTYLGWYVKETWTRNSLHNFFRIPSTNDVLHSGLNPNTMQLGQDIYLDITAPQNLDYWFGDFNGDGTTDIFKADGTGWYYLPLNTGYVQQWIRIAWSGYTLGTLNASQNGIYKITPHMVLNHFDANNTTDFIAQGSGQMIVSFNGSSWTSSITSARLIDQYRFGYFKVASQAMNYLADPFYVASNGDWKIAHNLSTWQTINSAPINNFDHIKTGDFNGDGISDILYAPGTQWKYSSNALSSWINLYNLTTPCNDLEVGDINADGKSDIFGLYQNYWAVSTGGATNWTFAKCANFPRSSFHYGNLD